MIFCKIASNSAGNFQEKWRKIPFGSSYTAGDGLIILCDAIKLFALPPKAQKLQEAGPSTSLRSAQDDNAEGGYPTLAQQQTVRQLHSHGKAVRGASNGVIERVALDGNPPGLANQPAELAAGHALGGEFAGRASGGAKERVFSSPVRCRRPPGSRPAKFERR